MTIDGSVAQLEKQRTLKHYANELRQAERSRGFVVRRIFDTDEGPIARWWMGPWGEEDADGLRSQGFGEPEDAQIFRSEHSAKLVFVGSQGDPDPKGEGRRYGQLPRWDVPGWSRPEILERLFADAKRTSVQSYEDALAEVGAAVS